LSAPDEIISQRNEIKRFIARAEFDSALPKLIDFATNYKPDLEDDAVSLSSRYYRIVKAAKNGDISWDEGQRELTKVGAAMLGLLRDITQDLAQAC
jgi:Effector-associated domain 11